MFGSQAPQKKSQTHLILVKQRDRLEQVFNRLHGFDVNDSDELHKYKGEVTQIVKAARKLKDALFTDILEDVINWGGKERDYDHAIDELTKLEQENLNLRKLLDD